MTEVKSRLHGGMEEKKKKGAEMLRLILDSVKANGVLSESELAGKVGLDKKSLSKYVEYLKEKELIAVKKRIFGEAEISLTGKASIRPKQEHPAEEKKQEIPPEVQKAISTIKSWEAQRSGTEPQPEPPAAPEPEEKVGEPPAEPVKTEPTQPVEPAPGIEPKFELAKPMPKTKPEEPPAQPPAPVQKVETQEKKPDEPAGVGGGEKVVPETAQELREVVKSLVTDFIGVMRLYGEAQGQSYTAGLLIDKGEIVAVSFEHMDTVELSYGDEAMKEIQSKFMGTKGDLEIYEMSEDDLNASLRDNANYMLSAPVKLSTMNIRIKSRLKEEPEAAPKGSLFSKLKGALTTQDTSVKEERKKMMRDLEKKEGKINLVEFARSLTIDPLKAKRFEELRKLRQGVGSQRGETEGRKAERLQELKLQQATAAAVGILGGGNAKEARLEEMRQARAEPIKVEVEEKIPTQAVQEGHKVETNIDKLYSLVESQGKLRINDALAAKLKVSKTQIEEWAMILEEHGLLELKYPTMGEPEIISAHPSKNVKNEAADGKKKQQ
ncbi:MAG: DUF2226 domain-containing protein [Candidatus Altiarchaeota archaeon]